MAFLDKLIGIDEIEKQRRLADEVANARFDPDVLNPQILEAVERLIEGIDEAPLRSQAVSSIFGRGDINEMGGSAGRQLSFMERLNQQRSEALAGVESKIGIAEAQAKSQAKKEVADLQTKQRQIQQERDARIRENRLMAEAESERRRKQFGSTVGKLTGTIAGSFLGPAGAAIGGGLGGFLFGGGGQGAATGAVTGGVSSVVQKKISDFLGTESGQMSIRELLGLDKSKGLLGVAEGHVDPTQPSSVTASDIRTLLNG